MSLTNTLTKKFVLISLAIGILVSLYFFSGFLFTHHISGEAHRINLAGNMRFRAYRMAFLSQMLAEKTFSKEMPFTRKQLLKELAAEIAIFEDIALEVKRGDEKKGIGHLAKYQKLVKEYNRIIDQWEKEMKPALSGFLNLPPDASEKQLRTELYRYNARVSGFVARIDRLVASLTDHHEREIQYFNYLRIAGIGILAVITAFVFVYMRRSVVKPLKQLEGAAKSVEKGDFRIAVEVRTNDDIGRLIGAFNSMSRTVGELLDEKTRTVEEVTFFNKIAAASQSLTIDTMLDEFLKIILSFGSLSIKNKGAIFTCDDDNKRLRLAASVNFSESHISTCSNIAYGECLCGIASEKGIRLVTDSIRNDKRHIKTYPGMEDHGHIVIPLRHMGRRVGVLCLYIPAQSIVTEKTLELLTTASELMSVSLQNSLNYRQAAMLAQAFDSSSDAIFITDSHGIMTYVNPMAMWQLGYAREETLDRSLSVFFSGPEAEGLFMEILKSAKKSYWSGNIIMVMKDGTEYPALLTISPVKDSDGNLTSLICIARDITEIKHKEEQLKKSEASLANAQRIAHIGNWEWEITENRLQWSDEVSRILGIEPGKIAPSIDIFRSYIHPDDLELFSLSLDNALSSKKNFSSDHRIVLKDGSERTVHEEAEVIVNKKGVPVRITGTIQDITEYKRLEEQFRQSQKMEAIGTLTGGVAHDFNNILTAIIGYSSVIQMKMKDDDPLKTYANQILAATERAANLTQSLLAFSRKQIINPVPLNLNDIVIKVEKLLRRIIGEDIELISSITEDNLIVYADSGKIEQVLINLCTNARDAMPRGGRLNIRTRRVALSDMNGKIKKILLSEIQTKLSEKSVLFAEVTVEDTGTGIDEKLLDRIFEPFFTTKEVGKGTGLGLSMAYGIVKQHNGYIIAESEKGAGTVFRIYLPLHDERPGMKVGEESRFASVLDDLPSGGGETLLIAEDDNDVRSFTVSVLREFGYKVIEAVDGDDAVAKFMENSGRIDLMLFDVVMPKRNGREAYEIIKKTSPDIRVVFLSGYTANIIHKQGILEKDMNFILKPVSPKDLLRRVREVLDKR